MVVPPPSKSYLLNIVDSSDEEESDDCEMQTQTQTPTPTPTPTPAFAGSGEHDVLPDAASTFATQDLRSDLPAGDDSSDDKASQQDDDLSTLDTSREEHHNDNDNDNDNDNSNNDDGTCTTEQSQSSSTSSPAPVNAKNKRRKRKKKKKKGSASQSARVSFGTVSLREFGRCLGSDVVPGDGGWPLGLSREIVAELDANNTVDRYEVEKQARLTARWIEIHQQQLLLLQDNVIANDGDGGGGGGSGSGSGNQQQQIEEQQPPAWLETRQRDYKRQSKNPLFGRMAEKDRMSLLLADSQDGDVAAAPQEMLTRKRSGSTDKVYNTTRSRSGSFDKSRAHNTRSRSDSIVEQYNDTYTQIEVHHVRNELEQLRNSRSMQGSTGCTCRKLQVYLLPPGGGGKKAHHRRMNVLKLKEELRKRHLLPQESLTREELELLLHDAVETEPCCNDDCSCVRDGIDCQADTCSCWLTSHQADKGKNHDDHPSIANIKVRCGNPFGIYTVDAANIDSFRTSFICPEIKAPSDA